MFSVMNVTNTLDLECRHVCKFSSSSRRGSRRGGKGKNGGKGKRERGKGVKQEEKGGGRREKRNIRELWHEVKQVLSEDFLGYVSLSKVLNLVWLSRHRLALQVIPEGRTHLNIQAP